MARVDIKSGGVNLNAGVLQLQNGVAMDATLRNVADQANTVSPLKLSTTIVQVTSPLRITTDDASDFYLDCEDGSTNNRFSIKRNTASQQVNLDFASNPTGSTTTVGAIRTFRDGVNLSEVMTFREDGNVGFGTTTPTFSLVVARNAGQLRIISTGDSSSALGIGNDNNNSRLLLSGGESNNGSIARINANGGVIMNMRGSNLTIANSNVDPNNTPSLFGIRGSGSTSATTSLLVQNSGGTNLLSVVDNGNITQTLGTATFFNGVTVQFAGIQCNNNGPINTGGTINAQGNLNQIGNFQILKTGNALNSGFGLSTEFSSVNFQGDTLGSSGPGSQFTFRKYNNTTADLSNISSGIIRVQNTGFNHGNANNLTGATLWLQPIYNFTNASITGTKAIGIYYDPTLTSLVNTTHIGIQTISGGAYINTATPAASAALQADSTTQGFLPPRMTTAQKVTLAATATAGLMIYDTDLNKLCVYTGAAFETITSV